MRNVTKAGTLALSALLLTAISVGCAAASRRKALTIFFDGVPPPQSAEAVGAVPSSSPGSGTPPRRVGRQEHGPYAAKLCNACHETGATNALVAPRDELCFRCHDLRMDTAYTHGPLASGGCLVCHDPHSSQYDNLLVSESDTFCFHCHDRATVEKIEGHLDPGDCTVCHDAHGSDTKYLLK